MAAPVALQAQNMTFHSKLHYENCGYEIIGPVILYKYLTTLWQGIEGGISLCISFWDEALR